MIIVLQLIIYTFYLLFACLHHSITNKIYTIKSVSRGRYRHIKIYVAIHMWIPTHANIQLDDILSETHNGLWRLATNYFCFVCQSLMLSVWYECVVVFYHLYNSNGF